MQNFNMFTNCMQGLKMDQWKLYEDGSIPYHVKAA